MRNIRKKKSFTFILTTGILGVLTATAHSQLYMCQPCKEGYTGNGYTCVKPATTTSGITAENCSISETLYEFTEGGKEQSGKLEAGTYLIILGGGNGGGWDKKKSDFDFGLNFNLLDVAPIGGQGGKLQYIFKLDKAKAFTIASGSDGSYDTSYAVTAGGGGGASWLRLADVDASLATIASGGGSSTHYIAGGGGGRAPLYKTLCEYYSNTAQGGFGGGLGAGGGGGRGPAQVDGHFTIGSTGGASGNAKGGEGADSADQSGERGGYVYLTGGKGCLHGGCCNTGAIGGASYTSTMRNKETKENEVTYAKYGGVGGFCTSSKSKYDASSHCHFNSSSGEQQFSEVDKFTSTCLSPLQEISQDGKTYYIRHPGNGDTSHDSNTDQFSDKLCAHCAKLYKLTCKSN